MAAIIDQPSPNHGPRPPGISVDTMVLHYTGMRSAEDALDRLRDPLAKVSAHYLIDEDGTVVRLVSEMQRAWHAGVAYWRGHKDINSRSIGIELVNPGHEFGYRPFPDDQMRALIGLSLDIFGRHPIEPRNIVGHSDIAPDRKIDPGESFDWRVLAEAGIGLWPTERAAETDAVASMLSEYGYDPLAANALQAFQRHFRPSKFDGIADEQSARRLAGLMTLID